MLGSTVARPTPTQLFITRVWGFNPADWPAIVFNHEGDRSNLLRDARPGDCIVLMGTRGRETEPEDQGRLLGLAEIGRSEVATEKIVRPLPKDLDEHGRIRWPYAIPMVRAWRFRTKPWVTDVMPQPSYSATVRAELLADEVARRILSLDLEPVDVPEFKELLRARDRIDALVAARGPTVGPVPTAYVGELNRTDGISYAYAFRFGSRDVWKIGWTKNLSNRIRKVNIHIPDEVTRECWEQFLSQRFPNSGAAYRMEQRVLELLKAHRTSGERVACSEKAIRDAWVRALMG